MELIHIHIPKETAIEEEWGRVHANRCILSLLDLALSFSLYMTTVFSTVFGPSLIKQSKDKSVYYYIIIILGPLYSKLQGFVIVPSFVTQPSTC